MTGAILAEPGSSDAEKMAAIETLLVNYRSNQLTEDFKVGQANGMFYIVPTKALSKSGVAVAASSLLALPVRGEPARDILYKIVRPLTGASVSYRLLSIPQGKGGTDCLLSMQVAGSAPWAKSALEITGFPFGASTQPSATPSDASHVVFAPTMVKPGAPTGVSLFGTTTPPKPPSQYQKNKLFVGGPLYSVVI